MRDYDGYKEMKSMSGGSVCPTTGKTMLADDVWEKLLAAKLKAQTGKLKEEGLLACDYLQHGGSVASIAIHIGRSKKADDSSSDVEQVGDTDRVYDAGDVDMGQRNKKKSRQGPNADDSLQEVRDLVKWVKLYLEHKMQQGLQATGNSELPKLLFDELTGSSDLQADVWGLATVAHWRLNLSEVALFSFFFYFVFKREADV
ncbi:hypothetical protein PC123_g3417 [Phytophthora cactorum]|nr:hypothetical protein PC123_g3417 [Phytophthora cactorum]